MTLNEKLSFWKQTIAYGISRDEKLSSDNIKVYDLVIDITGELNHISIEPRGGWEKWVKDEFGTDKENAVDEFLSEMKT